MNSLSDSSLDKSVRNTLFVVNVTTNGAFDSRFSMHSFSLCCAVDIVGAVFRPCRYGTPRVPFQAFFYSGMVVA